MVDVLVLEVEVDVELVEVLLVEVLEVLVEVMGAYRHAEFTYT